MANKTIAGKVIDVNDEGYLTDHTQWTKEIAVEIAREEGIAVLTENHWKVLSFIQEDFKTTGVVPSIRRLKSAGNIPTKELYEWFPDGPLKKASKIAGLKKPASCI